jgi:uncharacterized protein
LKRPKPIGRKKEINLLTRIINSPEAEFLAVYGRRRVGKTYLLQTILSAQKNYFECTGLKDGSTAEQLANFNTKFSEVFYGGAPLQPPKNWSQAFERLTEQAKKLNPTQKFIVFFDELPWLANPRSKLLQNIDYFWNTQWSKLPNFKFVVCGSAASWMISNLINAKGGLHNRVTRTMRLDPFTLLETKQFLEAQKIKVTNKQVLDLYMVMGGIPFYLKRLEKSKSLVQNVNDLCFQEEGLLFQEFPRLFKSLFDDHALNLKIVTEIAKKHYGIPFRELVDLTEKKAGGRFMERLHELESAGFIRSFIPYGRTKRDRYYRVIDPYTLFYLKWIRDVSEGHKIPKGVDYWTKISQSPTWSAWAGYAFEVVCLTHLDKIIRALGLDKTGCLVSGWQQTATPKSSQRGAQIDLLFDRDDKAINLCEIKYSATPFTPDKDYANLLKNKINVFDTHAKHSSKQIFLALILATTFKPNIWSEDLVDGVVELDDFFQEYT